MKLHPEHPVQPNSPQQMLVGEVARTLNKLLGLFEQQRLRVGVGVVEVVEVRTEYNQNLQTTFE